MKHLFFPIVLICSVTATHAQSYTLADLENQFLKNNTQLLATRFNLEKAQAEIIQEKLWSNPELTISEINLWKTNNVEELPNLIGSYGKNQQLSVELEQLIQTAGKRKKNVRLKQLEKQSAAFDYEELLRELRTELRQTYYAVNRLQQEQQQLEEVLLLFQQMNEQYQHQAQLQNIPVADFYRIQSELIGLQKEQLEGENELMEAVHKLRILTHNSNLELKDLSFPTFIQNYSQKLPPNLFEIAKIKHIDLKRQENERAIMQQQLTIEKAKKTPDVTAKVTYDRGGSIMRDFVGFGINFDLPIFNTNKGNIKAAKIAVQQQMTNEQMLEEKIEQTILQLQNQLIRIEQTFQNWPNSQLSNQQQMMQNYKKHLQNKQVTLLEFIDFTKAYREAYRAHLTLQQTYLNTVEELQHIVGQDF